MSSYMDMSLDDIIRMQRQEARAKRNRVRPQKFKPVPKMNARYKFIPYHRTNFTDARQKLTQLAEERDARFKLNMLRQERETTFVPVRNTYRRGVFTRAPPSTEIIFADPSRQVTAQPLATATSYTTHSIGLQRQTFNEARSIENPKPYEYQYTPRPKPSPRHTAVGWGFSMHDEAPKDEEYIPQPLSMMKRRPSIEYSYESRAADEYTNSIEAFQRTILPETIPKKNSAVALLSDLIRQKFMKPRLEYRIIISNLSPTVSESDIQQLFEDVGEMMDARLVRPGIGEVIYKRKDDAEAAVALFHNRKLDGYPMNCLLITPRVPIGTATRTCPSENQNLI